VSVIGRWHATACDGTRSTPFYYWFFLHPAAAPAGRACGAATRRTRPSTAATSRPLRDRDQVLVANVATLVMRAEQLHVQIANGADVVPRGRADQGSDGRTRRCLAAVRRLQRFRACALMMQALGLLAGSGSDAEREYGYLFVAFRPDLIGSADAFERQMTRLIERIKATPRRPGIDDIRIRSERAFHSRERALHEGLEIDRVVFDALVALRAR
jgi:hypothetical protein